MKLNELRNPFNNFDISSWSGSIINKINNTLKRRRSDEDENEDENDDAEDQAEPSKKQQKQQHDNMDLSDSASDVFDSQGIRHDDHLHLHSTKLDDQDDALIYDTNTQPNDFDDNDDYKANDDYWAGEDPPDDRDDNVLAKQEFEKGYDDASDAGDEDDYGEEDELDNPDFSQKDEEEELEEGNEGASGAGSAEPKTYLNPQQAHAYGEEVVGQVDGESDRVDSASEEEEEEEEEEEDYTQTLPQRVKVFNNNEPIELSSDSE